MSREIESETGLCIDYSGGSRLRRGCLFHNRLYSLLLSIVRRPAESGLTTPFPFRPVKEICEIVFCCFRCYAWNFRKKKKKKKTEVMFRAPWRVGDEAIGRGNAGWTTSKTGHP